MKRIFLLSAVLISGIILMSSCNKKEKENTDAQEVKLDKEAVSYPVDLANSKVLWLGKKVTGQHNGTINLKSGEVLVKNDTLTGGRFEFDMNSITDLDLTDEKMNAKLTGHLKSADFFNVDSFATATFEITSAEMIANPVDSNNYNISGNLTIKGITNNISFPAVIVSKDGMFNAKATIKVDRTLWNIRYGSGKFFKGLGDKMINDEFEVTIDILAQKPAEVAENK